MKIRPRMGCSVSLLSVILAIVSCVLLLVGCEFGDPGVATQGTTNTYDLIGLTADDKYPGDTIHVSGDWNTTFITAPTTNQGGNSRIGFTVNAPNFDWNETCATWVSHSGPIDQPGHVLHFDGTRAITVTQNIYLGARSVANVHLWDLSKSTSSGQRYTLLSSFTLPSMINDWPLRSCARAYGSTVAYKVWPTTIPEPAWGDACCSFQTTVPFSGPGRPGWFAGHLFGNGEMVWHDLYLHAI